MPIETDYISSACNQLPRTVHWGKNDFICYASCNAVLILDPKIGGGKVTATLHRHTGRVNAVRWFSNTEYEQELVSGSTDGNVIVWTFNIDTESYIPCVLSGHTSNVDAVDAIYKNDDDRQVIVASASMDNSVIIWTRQSQNAGFVQWQKISFGYGICITLKFTFLPKTDTLILATSLDSSSIQLYLENETDFKFEKSAKFGKNEDWVPGLDFTVEESTNDLLLAAASQDNTVEIWRISAINKDISRNVTNKIVTKAATYQVINESILSGHEGWVYSAHWAPNSSTKLLTASIDKSVIIWEFDIDVKLWLETVRMGEVGGNTLGFYGGMFSNDGLNILAYSYHGAFHIWNNVSDGVWQPAVTVGGHYGEVSDFQWSPEGEYILSVSNDMTARVHAPWQSNNTTTWHEIARPQVHGHSLTCLSLVSKYSYISGAEEKIFRMFEAPFNFIQNFRQICQLQPDDSIEAVCPKGASVPSLGLSNKAIYNSNNDDAIVTSKKEPYPEESHFTAVNLFEPPTEETLIQNTLWPELKKLYGHGYEVLSVSVSPNKSFIATSCKSTTPEHAAIIIWDTKTYTILQKLAAHNLTVVQLEFSPDSQKLLAVSRDRRWSIFELSNGEYKLSSRTDKKLAFHTRIIWCCAWSHDSKFFLTGSRDGKAVIWEDNPEITELSCKHKPASDILNLGKESITAVCFGPDIVNTDSYINAVGTENGFVRIYNWNRDGWKNLYTLDNNIGHHLTVRRLRFRPCVGLAGDKETNNKILQLASSSSDFSLRIYHFTLD